MNNFLTSGKTKVPSCCNLECCGNKFGRITSKNRITKTRRYAKRAERNIVRREILNQIIDDEMYIDEEIRLRWQIEENNLTEEFRNWRDECYEDELYDWTEYDSGYTCNSDDYAEKYGDEYYDEYRDDCDDPEWPIYDDSFNQDEVDFLNLITGGPRNLRQNGVTE